MNLIARALRREPEHQAGSRSLRAFLRGAALATALGCAAPAAAASRPRALIVALDAIRFEDAARARFGSGEDLFPGFQGPVPLVSTFPSSTSLAMPGLLEPFGLERSPGYEPRFFDREKGKVRGGGLVSYHKIPFAWRDFFDWEIRSLIQKTIGYGWPLRANRREIQRAIEAFLDSDAHTFFAYVNSTDATGHLYGPATTAVAIEELGRALAEVRERHPDPPFYTVILSDHGMGGGEPLRNALPGVARVLREDGWRLRRKIRDPRDAVLIPFGLLSSLVAHASPGREAALARTLCRAEGVELCAHPDGQGWVVVARGAEAAIRRCTRNGRVLWSYAPVSGDPLRYGPVLARLASQAAGTDEDGWYEDRAWFETTLDHDFPDALHRIARSFDLVANPASVVCSMAPGWLYGSRRLVLGTRLTRGRLQWTHGALRSEDSLGFIMSDFPGWKPGPGVRFDAALRFFAELPDLDRAGGPPAASPEIRAASASAACRR